MSRYIKGKRTFVGCWLVGMFLTVCLDMEMSLGHGIKGEGQEGQRNTVVVEKSFGRKLIDMRVCVGLQYSMVILWLI